MRGYYKIGLLGLTIFLLSYTLALFSDPLSPSVDKAIRFALQYLFITIGLTLLFSSIEYKLHQRSLLQTLREKPALIWRILLVGGLIGIFSEYFGGILSRIWWDPIYSQVFASWPFWLAVLIWFVAAIGVAYGSLGFSIFSIYRVLNLLLSHFDSSYHFRFHIKALFYWLAWIGSFAVIFPVLVILFLPNIDPVLRGSLFLFPLLGLWFIFEYIEHRQHKRSLLVDLSQLKIGKIIALVVTALLTGLAIEGLNAISPAWQYHNVPLINIQVANIPIFGVIYWIPFIILYLSLYRIFVKYDRSTF